MRITIDIEASPQKSSIFELLAPLATMLAGYIIGKPHPVEPLPFDECKPHSAEERVNDILNELRGLGARVKVVRPDAKSPTWEEALAKLTAQGLPKEVAEEMLRAPGSPFASGAV